MSRILGNGCLVGPGIFCGRGSGLLVCYSVTKTLHKIEKLFS